MGDVPTRRDPSIDVARGLAIIAIVVGHVLVGVRASGQIAMPAWVGQVMPALYLVHIVVFALLAGLFVESGVRRRGARRYLLTRAALLGGLDVLWSVIQRGVRLATGAGNSDVAITEILHLWIPEGQLWFLPWLLAATALLVITAPWRGAVRRVMLLALAVAIGWATWGWEPSLMGLRGAALTAFFVAGSLVGAPRLRGWCSRGVPALLLVLVALSAGYLAVVVGGEPYADPTASSQDRSPAAVVRGVAGSMAGTGAVLAASALLARTSLRRVLGFLGRRSMEIYLAHIVAGSAVRVLLLRLGVDDASRHVILGTLTGITGPLILWWVARQARQSWLFSLPGWAERRLQGRLRP